LVDKNPSNLQWLPLIHRLFPESKFILALRHPCDAILSNYMQEYRSTILAIASANLERLGHAYVAAMQSWLHHVDVFKPAVCAVRYEDLVADPAAQATRMGRFLDIGDASALLNFQRAAREKGFISTPSYTKVVEPISRNSINRWLAYRQYFKSVIPIIQPMLDHWGYSADGMESSEGTSGSSSAIQG
jgi:hypothetical protein